MENPPLVQSLGNIDSLAYFGPELVLIATILLVIIWDLGVKEQRTKILGVLVDSLDVYLVADKCMLLHLFPQGLQFLD